MKSERDGFWEYIESRGVVYEESILCDEGDLYERTGRIINCVLKNGMTVLDVGNGGVINYDYSRLNKLVCGDLEVSNRVREKYRDAPNVTFEVTDITNMFDIQDRAFDVVIVQNVIHHLADNSYNKTVANLYNAIEECIRVLRNGGELVILESTLKSYAYLVERLLFSIMMIVLRLIKFDCVFQYSKGKLKREIEKHEGIYIKEEGYVKEGRYTIYAGKKIPSVLLPLTFSYFIIKKAQEKSEV